MNCLICDHNTTLLFKKRVLNKHDVSYFQCSHCGFIQTEKPYWLKEAYDSAIADLDVGLVQRNQLFAPMVEKILSSFFNVHKRFLDWGGGYGLFVRMMRDKGFDFYRQDLYCDNLFAHHFDFKDLHKKDQTFALVTAFEVFEHLEDPYQELTKIFQYTDTVLFSTELVPDSDLENWWYLVPETGQHISFYTPQALQILGDKFDCSFYTNGSGLHLLSKKHFKYNPFACLSSSFIERVLRKSLSFFSKNKTRLPSLLQQDYEHVLKCSKKS